MLVRFQANILAAHFLFSFSSSVMLHFGDNLNFWHPGQQNILDRPSPPPLEGLYASSLHFFLGILASQHPCILALPLPFILADKTLSFCCSSCVLRPPSLTLSTVMTKKCQRPRLSKDNNKYGQASCLPPSSSLSAFLGLFFHPLSWLWRGPSTS